MGIPEASIVIPTRARETRLAFALDGLASQTVAKDRFEVIVVRAPEPPDTPVTEAPAGLDVRFVESPRAGTAIQRNVGWRNARAPLIIFSDDDCRAASDWLERLLAAESDPDVVRHGRVEPDPEQLRHLWDIARTIEVGPDSPWFETCNIAYHRDLLERVGGFDEEFGFMGEDTDLGYRAVEAGARRVFVGDAVMWHAVYPRNLPQAVRDAVKRSSVPRLVKRYPQIRDSLVLGTFTGKKDIYVLVALFGLAIGRRAPLLGAACVAPYVWRRVNPDRLTSPWGVIRTAMSLATVATVDAVQVGAYAASSVRHRSLVL